MKTYIFLTFTIGSFTGGPIYIRNKVLFLKGQGWNVMVFDSKTNRNNQKIIKELLEYKQNRIPELFYYPSWFNKIQRDKTLNTILTSIPESEEYVVESNSLILGAWGELLAKKLNAKHILFSIGEHNRAYTKDEYDFLKYKAERNELFSIFPEAYKTIFEKFDIVGDPNDHVWNANVDVPVEDVYIKELEEIGTSSVNIGYFGRYKPFMDKVLADVNSFAFENKGLEINLIVQGIGSLDDRLLELLKSPNIKICCINSSYPLPKSFFDKCNVIFATSGCARIAYETGAKVVGMDVKQLKPLGVVGYDTVVYTYAEEGQILTKTCKDYLYDVLINKKYDEVNPIGLPDLPYGLKYQLKCTERVSPKFYNSLKVYCFRTFSTLMHGTMIKLGLCKCLTILRNRA